MIPLHLRLPNPSPSVPERDAAALSIARDPGPLTVVVRRQSAVPLFSRAFAERADRALLLEARLLREDDWWRALLAGLAGLAGDDPSEPLPERMDEQVWRARAIDAADRLNAIVLLDAAELDAIDAIESLARCVARYARRARWVVSSPRALKGAPVATASSLAWSEGAPRGDIEGALRRARDWARDDDFDALAAWLEEEAPSLARRGWGAEIHDAIVRARHPRIDAHRLALWLSVAEERGAKAPVSPPSAEAPAEAWVRWAMVMRKRLDISGARRALARARSAPTEADRGSPLVRYASALGVALWFDEEEMERAAEAALKARDELGQAWGDSLAAFALIRGGALERGREAAGRAQSLIARGGPGARLAEYAARVECARAIHLDGEVERARALMIDAPRAPDDADLFARYQWLSVEYMRALLELESLALEQSEKRCVSLLARVAPPSRIAIHARSLLIGVISIREPGAPALAQLFAEQQLALDATPRPAFSAWLEVVRLRYEVGRASSWLEAPAPQLDAVFARATAGTRESAARFECEHALRTSREPLREAAAVLGPAERALYAVESSDRERAAREASERIERAKERGHWRRVHDEVARLWSASLYAGDLDAARAWLGELVRLAHRYGLRRPEERALLAWLDGGARPEAAFAHLARRWARVALLMIPADAIEERQREALWRFGDWRASSFGPGQRAIWFAPALGRAWTREGRALHLRAGSHARMLLEALARAPQGIGKEELLRIIWRIDDHHPARHENRLRVAIFKLRKRLDEFEAGASSCVATLPDGGYRLEASVVIETELDAS